MSSSSTSSSSILVNDDKEYINEEEGMELEDTKSITANGTSFRMNSLCVSSSSSSSIHVIGTVARGALQLLYLNFLDVIIIVLLVTTLNNDIESCYPKEAQSKREIEGCPDPSKTSALRMVGEYIVFGEVGVIFTSCSNHL